MEKELQITELNLFLQKCYSDLKQWKTLKEIYIVLGNESCDLDSTVSCLAYGFLLFKTLKVESSKEKAIFPVLNIPRNQFHLRLEHCYLLKEVGINLDTLIFRSEINFEEVIENISSSNKSVQTFLVDHHVTSAKDQILNKTVCKIFDHRPLIRDHRWVQDETEIIIEMVGSCATIIGNKIFNENKEIWNKELAYLVYCTILLDTKGLRLEKNKATKLDYETASKLEMMFNFKEHGLSLYKKLENLHCTIAHLTPYEMLIKDLKCIDSVAFPRICVLAITFIYMEGGLDALNYLCSERNSSIAVVIGSDKTSKEKKDIGIFFKCNNKYFIEKFIHKFRQFGLKHSHTELGNFIVFKFKDKKMTRKEIVPIVMKIYI